MKSKVISRSVKLTSNINPAELSFKDQLRLLASKVGNTDEAELDAATKINIESARKMAALNDLFEKAINKMNSLGESCVTIGVSSNFYPYIDKVVDKKEGKGRFYDIEVYKRDLPSTVLHQFTVVIRKKK